MFVNNKSMIFQFKVLGLVALIFCFNKGEKFTLVN